MYLRKVVMLNLFVSLTMSQEQLRSDIDGEALVPPMKKQLVSIHFLEMPALAYKYPTEY